MRSHFDHQLAQLNKELIEMGSLCEEVIAMAAKALTAWEPSLIQNITALDQEIDQMERDIETQCLKMLLQQQPVAKDLRQISAALKMITDMERIGDQAADIADILEPLKAPSQKGCADIKDMALATIEMVKGSITAYVNQDISLAKQVIAQDDIVDAYFSKVKFDLIEMIAQNPAQGEYSLDWLMIAKYFERIGDHATNIAEWVEFSVTGIHKSEIES